MARLQEGYSKTAVVWTSLASLELGHQKLAPLAGIEPATFRLGGKRSSN